MNKFIRKEGFLRWVRQTGRLKSARFCRSSYATFRTGGAVFSPRVSPVEEIS